MKGKGQKICHECGGVMVPCTTSKTLRYLGKEIEIKGLEGYQCTDCGERVFSSQEVKMIENLMKALSEIQVPKVDVLNLEETAEYLRVSNQTVYNMIRDGRIKAYKVGREWRFLHSDILAYMNSSANTDTPLMAAKGGTISKEDFDIIQKEIDRRKE
ncbi:MAG: helix-turn-helix domain-containing protein [Lachnospiraceae bacterium]|nr:helix-turn-helix domain-containing protein [Lachnospiraceae bacterium]